MNSAAVGLYERLYSGRTLGGQSRESNLRLFAATGLGSIGWLSL